MNVQCKNRAFRPALELLSLCAELLAHLYPSLVVPLDSTKHAITLFILALTQAVSTIVTFLTPLFHRAKISHGDFICTFLRKTILALLAVYLDDGLDDAPSSHGALFAASWRISVALE